MQEGQQDLFEPAKFKPVPAPVVGDICSNFHGGADTSKEAFQSTPQSSRTAQQARILKFISDRGSEGATCDEAERALQLPHQTASARITELTAAGRIQFGTDRRKTIAGKSARVYRAAGI